MSYDTYRSHPDTHQAPHTSSSYDHSYASSAHTRDSQHRASTYSNTGPDGLPPQQPLKNAIGNAFEKSDAARVVDPNLIAQITEQVKKSVLEEIKASVVAGATQAQPVHVTQHEQPSPTSSFTPAPPRDVYTPPSPKRTDSLRPASLSPDPLACDPLLDEDDDTPVPRNGRTAPVDIPIPAEQPTARPATVPRMATDDCTPIEKMWQRLFDQDGQPLPRLGEFLRGLALHLVCHDFDASYIVANRSTRLRTMSPSEAW